MTTFDQITARVRQLLLGFTMNQESVSALSETMTDSDTSFSVDADTVESLSRGVVEIDDELILVKGYDRGSGAATVMGGANGRGYEGTTPAQHAAGALVTASPGFPRARIKEAVNDTVRGLYPALVTFGTTSFPRVSTQLEYELPAEATDVWAMHAEITGPSKVGQPMKNYRFNAYASTADFPTGKSVQQLDSVTPGETIHVTYTKTPGAMTAGTDDFETATGYPERVIDLVTYGAMMRLLPALASARLQLKAVESSERAHTVGGNDAAKAVQLYSALYETRLEDERNRQFNDRPISAFYGG